jgi:hypothetical protein
MQIDWATLGAIAVVAAAASLTVSLLVSLAVVAWSARSRRAVDGPDDGGGASAVRARTGAAVALLCVLAAGLVVGYGLYLIVA